MSSLEQAVALAQQATKLDEGGRVEEACQAYEDAVNAMRIALLEQSNAAHRPALTNTMDEYRRRRETLLASLSARGVSGSSLPSFPSPPSSSSAPSTQPGVAPYAPYAPSTSSSSTYTPVSASLAPYAPPPAYSSGSLAPGSFASSQPAVGYASLSSSHSAQPPSSHSSFSPAAYEQARTEAAQQAVSSDPLVGCMVDTHLHHLMQSAIMLTAKAREAEARQDWSAAFSFYTTALDNMAEVYKVETREEVLSDLRTRMSALMERAEQLKMRSAAPNFQVSPAAAPHMEKAVQAANRALVFDEAANFPEAVAAYLEAVEHLRRAAQVETVASLRNKIEAMMGEYHSRAALLQQHVEKGAYASPVPLGLRPGEQYIHLDEKKSIFQRMKHSGSKAYGAADRKIYFWRHPEERWA